MLTSSGYTVLYTLSTFGFPIQLTESFVYGIYNNTALSISQILTTPDNRAILTLRTTDPSALLPGHSVSTDV